MDAHQIQPLPTVEALTMVAAGVFTTYSSMVFCMLRSVFQECCVESVAINIRLAPVWQIDCHFRLAAESIPIGSIQEHLTSLTLLAREVGAWLTGPRALTISLIDFYHNIPIRRRACVQTAAARLGVSRCRNDLLPLAVLYPHCTFQLDAYLPFETHPKRWLSLDSCNSMMERVASLYPDQQADNSIQIRSTIENLSVNGVVMMQPGGRLRGTRHVFLQGATLTAMNGDHVGGFAQLINSVESELVQIITEACRQSFEDSQDVAFIFAINVSQSLVSNWTGDLMSLHFVRNMVRNSLWERISPRLIRGRHPLRPSAPSSGVQPTVMLQGSSTCTRATAVERISLPQGELHIHVEDGEGGSMKVDVDLREDLGLDPLLDFGDIPWKVIGQAAHSFVVCYDSTQARLLLLDQHAMHERIRYEALMKEYLDECMERLRNDTDRFPTILDGFAQQRCEYFWDVEAEHLEAEIESDGHNAELRWDLVQIALNQCAGRPDWTFVARYAPESKLQELRSRACRGSIMLRDCLDRQQCRQLVEEWRATDAPFQCAHGRLSGVISHFWLANVAPSTDSTIDWATLRQREGVRCDAMHS